MANFCLALWNNPIKEWQHNIPNKNDELKNLLRDSSFNCLFDGNNQLDLYKESGLDF